MKDFWFFIYHCNVLLVLWAVPYILTSFDKKPLEIFLVIISILSIELFVIGISNLTGPRLSRLIKGVWGGLLGVIAVITIVQISFFFQTKGSLLNWPLLQYAFNNTHVIWHIVKAEISIFWVARFLLIIPLVYPFTALGWTSYRLAAPKRLIAAACCLALSTIIISGIGGVGAAYYLNPYRQDSSLAKLESHVARSKLNNLKFASADIEDKYNIVIVILESIPAGATSMYSQKHDTTPFLNALSKTGLSAEKAYVVIPHTSKAVTAALCGQPPDIHDMKIFGARHEYLPFTCLPAMLKPLGYRSAFFQTATKNFEDREKLIASLGFDKFVPREDIDQKHWEIINYFGFEDRAMIEPAMDWVDKQDGPFLLSLLTLTSHHNYQVPSTFPKKQYEDSQVWNDYLNTVKYTDDFLHDLWTEFEQRNLLENTLFVFISDHGERFVDGQGMGHHQSLARDAIQIPFVVWNPRLIPQAEVATGPRQQIDVVPTILDLLNLKTTETALPGLSLLEPAENRVIYTACTFASCRGRISNTHKFIYHNKRKYEIIDTAYTPEQENDLTLEFNTDTVKKYIEEITKWQQEVKQLYY